MAIGTGDEAEILRPIRAGDAERLWAVLYHAAHMSDRPEETAADPRKNPDLRRYVEGWGRAGDVGVLAEDPSGELLGAAWVRRLTASDVGRPEYVDALTPELAIAVLPGHRGTGLGTRLMRALIVEAKGRFPAIVLTVREGNPARRLYDRLGFCSIDRITNRVGGVSWKMLLTLPGPD